MPASETGSSSVQGKIQDKSHGVLKNYHTESASTVTHGSSSASQPSSNYSNRSQQSIGPQKGKSYVCRLTSGLFSPWCSLYLVGLGC